MDLAQKEEAMVPASSLASVATRVEGWLGRMVEVSVALLTALEVLILLAGVISRYVFRNPLVWSDELAAILFLWLAMLGAVVAFRRGEHMRMSTLGCARAAALACLLRSLRCGGSDSIPCPDPAFEHRIRCR